MNDETFKMMKDIIKEVKIEEAKGKQQEEVKGMKNSAVHILKKSFHPNQEGNFWDGLKKSSNVFKTLLAVKGVYMLSSTKIAILTK